MLSVQGRDLTWSCLNGGGRGEGGGLEERVEDGGGVGGEGGGGVGGAGHAHPGVVAQVGVVVVAGPVVRAQGVAAAASLLANIGEGVWLTTEVQETRGEPRVEERSECLLLAWKRERRG